MALYVVYCQTDSLFAGTPICSDCLITQSKAAAIAKVQELTDSGLNAWYEQVQ